jgi:hypothetical protein
MLPFMIGFMELTSIFLTAKFKPSTLIQLFNFCTVTFFARLS